MWTQIFIGETAFVAMPLVDTNFIDAGAVFVITDVAPDGHWTPIAINETGETVLHLRGTELSEQWSKASVYKNLWVCVKLMPITSFTVEQRASYVQQLRSYFQIDR